MRRDPTDPAAAAAVCCCRCCAAASVCCARVPPALTDFYLFFRPGLAGLYFLRDRSEDLLSLPRGQFEVPIVIQDRSFNADGSLFYPSGPAEPLAPNPPNCVVPVPSIVPEFFGDAALVNGKVWPRLSVQPRKYRLRFLNGANARFFNPRLETCTCAAPPAACP